jgi:hypothetical protein
MPRTHRIEAREPAALIQLGALRCAYMRLGISSGVALFLLFASLIGLR